MRHKAMTRLEVLQGLLRGLDAILITNIQNVRYLTGFTGTAGFIFATKSTGVFYTDFRYKEQAPEQARGWDVVIDNKKMPQLLRGLVRRHGVRRLGVEGSLSCEQFEAISKLVPAKIAKALVEQMRAIKDPDELLNIFEAVHRAEDAFRDIKPHIKAGVRETQIASRLNDALLRRGCRRAAFDIIVASGPNGSRPHAGAVDRKLAPGDLVVIDWGGEAGGYFSDMTRTFLLKGGSDVARKKEIYRLVLEANRKGIASVRAGREAREIDNSARDVIKKAGYGKYFGHGLGHGIGRDVHELPRISGKERTIIAPGMVFTIEPGIYIPGLGGVRIEDMVAVTGVREGRKSVLTTLPVELEII